MPNTHRRRRCDATVELRRVGVGGVYGLKTAAWVILLQVQQNASRECFILLNLVRRDYYDRALQCYHYKVFLPFSSEQ